MPIREVYKTQLEVPPEMHEPPTQREPLLNEKIRKKTKEKKKRFKPSVAPVTKKDLRDMQDPLDYLAKYCIIQ